MGADHAAPAMMPMLLVLGCQFGRRGLGLLFRFAVARFRHRRHAFVVLQSGDRAALRNALAVDIFEPVFLARHDDAPIAQTRPRDAQFAAKAIVGVGSDAADAARLKPESGGAGT